MFHSILGIVGLCCACGLSAIDHSTIRVKNAISLDTSNVSVDTGFHYNLDLNYEDDDIDYDYKFLIADFEDYRVWNRDFLTFGNYIGLTDDLWFNANAFDDDITFTSLFPRLYSNYFTNSNYDSIVASGINLVGDISTPSSAYLDFYFTFAVNGTYFTNVASDGGYLVFDFAFPNNTIYTHFDYNDIDIELLKYDTSFVANSNNHTDLVFTPFSPYSTINSTSLSSFYNADIRYNYASIVSDYTFYNSELDTNSTGYCISFNSPFPNFGTAGFQSLNGSWFWNQYVFKLRLPVSDLENPLYPGEYLLSWPTSNGEVHTNLSLRSYTTNGSSSYASGYSTGYNDAYSAGTENADSTAYQNGYDAGFTAGQSSTGTSMTGLFGAIADTPIVMLRSMFNFDLFGFNVLATILSLMTGLILFYLLRKLF